MAFFSLVTGLIIVAGSVFVSRYSRIQESILFRTLGASTKQLNAMALGEYLVLGFLASTTGVLLALVASALVSIFVFEIDVSVPIMQSFLTVATVMLITGVIGVFSNRGISVLSPLEILRRESL